MSSPEAEVVNSLKQHLIINHLRLGAVSSVLVDAHTSYISSQYKARLEPMAYLKIGAYRPDILCQVQHSRTQSIAGFEVKPKWSDWRKGLMQARTYRPGVHHAYLAAPGCPNTAKKDAELYAKDLGVGILVRHEKEWKEVVKPPHPSPNPETLYDSYKALLGVPAARKLQLNHPLNYLVVAYLRHRHDGNLLMLLKKYFSDLRVDGTRKHAIVGARSLGLIGHGESRCILGSTVADLMDAIQFNPSTKIKKSSRLLDENEGLAAIARFVFLQHPAVKLIIDALHNTKPKNTPTLVAVTVKLDKPLASTLFFSNPYQQHGQDLAGEYYNPSTVYKLKQNLWHCGLLVSKAHISAGKKASDYIPSQDIWHLNSTVM